MDKLFLFFCSVPWLIPFALGPSPAVVPLLTSWVCMLAVAFMGYVRCRQSRNTDDNLSLLFAQAWLLAAGLSSGLGLIQYSGFSDGFSPWVNTTAPGEAFANLRQRNQFASLTNIGLLALIWWVGYSQRMSKRMSGGWLFAAAALLAVGNAASSSRTGLLQLMMVAVLVASWGGLRLRSVRWVIATAGIAYVMASIALPLLIGLEFGSSGILGRLNDGGAACSSRLILWKNVLHLISQKPWLGWGWGELDFAHFVTLYPGGADARFCEILDNAHNLPLHLAVELGVPFALVICGLGLWLVWRAKPWLEHDATRQLAWGVLAVIFLHSLLEYPLWYGPFQLAFGLCVWLLVTTPAQLQNRLSANVVKNRLLTGILEFFGNNRLLALVFIRSIAILMISSVAYAAWDYHRISQIYLAPAQRAEAYRTDTLAKIQGSWLFRNQVQFAELTTASVTRENASKINAMAQNLLHFSPEARVVEKLIDSAVLMGRHDEARFYAARYRAAYPAEYENWMKAASPIS